MNVSAKTRTSIIFLLLSGLYGIVACRLYYIQIINNNFYANLGEKQYNVTLTIYPPRAPIYDRSGNHFLAMNKDSVAAFILPKALENRAQLEPFLKRHFNAAYKRLKDNPPSHFMYIARRLTPEQIQLITNANITDIKFLNESGRFYPNESAGLVIGITDIDNKGLFGLELVYNAQLAGKPTTQILQKDARSGRFYFTHETTIWGHEGTSVRCTIDNNLQFLAYEELVKTIEQCHAKEGSIIVMNPNTGEILALAHVPTFNPNNTRILDMDLTKNPVVTETYELGSVIKVLAALAALEEGVVTPDELIDCEGVKTTYIDGRKVNTVPSSVAGVIPFSQVIEKSNNIGIAKVVRKLGPRLYDHYIRMGFGHKTGIAFPGEPDGFVNPPDNWSKQSLFSLSYGYEISATLLQLARAFCIIANGGYAIKPVLMIDDRSQILRGSPLYSATTIETIKNILEGTVLQGSAQKARIQGYRIMGKTGTANLLVNGSYSYTKNIYTFAGIVENSAPTRTKGSYQRVIVTFVKDVSKHNVYASTIAAPLFEKIAERMLIHDKIV